jgi:hypothetical protein
MIRSGSMFSQMLLNDYEQTNIIYRDPSNLTGEKGEKMQQTVWHEIVDALRKDVPEILPITQGSI